MGSLWKVKVKSEKLATASVNMRKLLISLFALLSLGVSAQDVQVLRGNCLPDVTDDMATARSEVPRKRLTPVSLVWNQEEVYASPVILVSFSDRDFTVSDDLKAFYNDLFNTQGFNNGVGRGCVADYFRDQSAGMFNARFDIYGPVKLPKGIKDYGKYGSTAWKESVQKAIDSLAVDFSPYDWNGDGKVEQVVFIYAGYGGNESAAAASGCIWPNTSSFSTVTTSGGIKISNYTCSAEMWSANKSCGIGTICHEFTHSLGLPDIYPTNSDNAYYSVVDEWDLMDGGNFVNSGWCPPNYSALEKILLGWLTPIELTEPASVVGMKPVSDGGDVYLIRHTEDEYLLLENRQWSGWDQRAPGQGLLITHVDYNASAWSANTVNNMENHHRYEHVHADNLDFNAWNAIVGDANPRVGGHNRHLSTSPYPWSTDSTDFVNSELTDTSVPAAKMFNANAEGATLLGKPVTNIVQHEDGTVSFDFMGGDPTAISTAVVNGEAVNSEVYDLQGRKVKSAGSGLKPGLYIRNGKVFLIK